MVATYSGLSLSVLTRASDAPVTSLCVVFCSFHWSFVPSTFSEPWKSFVPDFVMTFTIAPVARPYSAPAPDVMTLTSWMASKLRFEPNVPVVVSVLSTPSNRYTFEDSLAPWTRGLPELPLPGLSMTPGANVMSVW